jgi:hypothetical protein
LPGGGEYISPPPPPPPAPLVFRSKCGVLNQRRLCPNKKIFFMNEFADLRHIKQKKIGFIKWSKEFFCSNHLYFNYKDILPFFTKIIMSLNR